MLGFLELVHSGSSPDFIEFDGLFEKFYVASRPRGLQAFTGWPDYWGVSRVYFGRSAIIVEGLIGARRGVESHGVLLRR